MAITKVKREVGGVHKGVNKGGRHKEKIKASLIKGIKSGGHKECKKRILGGGHKDGN